MRLYVKQQRNLSFVPRSVFLILVFSLILQMSWHFTFNVHNAEPRKLNSPPKTETIRLLSFDESIASAKLTMLWLQAFDTQPGVSIPLRDLNYDRVIEWLDLILSLDNRIQYPLLAAIRFYAEVPVEDKQRKMIRYVSEKFLEEPDERWQFMTHAVYIAKHRIKDLQLALDCARLIRLYAKGNNVPYWAKQMEIFVLEDMGEIESAMILIGGLMESEELDSGQEAFLKQRLNELQQELLNDALTPDD